MRKERKYDILSNIILPVCLIIRKLFFATVFFLLFISSLDLSVATGPEGCYREPCTYQVGHIIQVIRALESSKESTQNLLPSTPDGTVWVHKPLESIQPVGHRYIRVNFRMSPIDSEESVFLTLHPPHEGLVQIDRLGVNTYFFELRPIGEVLGLEIEVRGNLRKVQDLNEEELRRLSPETIHLIWRNLASRQLSWLTAEQLNWRMGRGFLFPSFYKVHLTQEQVLGISRENMQDVLEKYDVYRWWKWFSEEQISWLTEDQLRVLVLDIKGGVTTENIKGITILGKIKLKRQMNQFSEKKISELTEDELRTLVLSLR